MQNYYFFSFGRLFLRSFSHFELTLPKKLMIMRRIATILCALLLVTSCASKKNAAADRLHPDQVFTITEDDIARETHQINALIQGDWTYKGPSVDVSGKNLLAGIGKPIAKGKLKKKLKDAFKKIGLNKAKPQFTFNQDGTCAIKLLGKSIMGTYNYNPDLDKISIKWHGVPVNARLKRNGKNKLHITFDADKLISLFTLVGSFSDSSTIKALSTLMDNYEDVMVGFELKR